MCNSELLGQGLKFFKSAACSLKDEQASSSTELRCSEECRDRNIRTTQDCSEGPDATTCHYKKIDQAEKGRLAHC